MAAKRIMTIKALENYFTKILDSGNGAVYRICETPAWYKINVEIEGISGSDLVAYYQTDKWSEIVDFCSSHCNPGYDTMCGLGCTEKELVEATTNYIHSLGKKTKYEE